MYPPLFEACAGDSSVSGLLEDATGLRLYPFGEAPQKAVLPYAVWAIGNGEPENYLGAAPDADAITTHLDVYGATAAEAREVSDALVAVLEALAHVVSWDGEGRDTETRAYHKSFTVDWIVNR